MAGYVLFPSGDVLHAYMRHDARANEELTSLFSRVGCKVQDKRERKIVVIVVAKNTFDGFNAIINLFEEYCVKNKRKNNLDLSRIRIEVFPTDEAASKSPMLEFSSFIYFPDTDLRDVDEYPQLANFLPFLT